MKGILRGGQRGGQSGPQWEASLSATPNIQPLHYTSSFNLMPTERWIKPHTSHTTTCGTAAALPPLAHSVAPFLSFFLSYPLPSKLQRPTKSNLIIYKAPPSARHPPLMPCGLRAPPRPPVLEAPCSPTSCPYCSLAPALTAMNVPHSNYHVLPASSAPRNAKLLLLNSAGPCATASRAPSAQACRAARDSVLKGWVDPACAVPSELLCGAAARCVGEHGGDGVCKLLCLAGSELCAAAWCMLRVLSRSAAACVEKGAAECASEEGGCGGGVC